LCPSSPLGFSACFAPYLRLDEHASAANVDGT